MDRILCIEKVCMIGEIKDVLVMKQKKNRVCYLKEQTAETITYLRNGDAVVDIFMVTLIWTTMVER